MGKGQYKGSTSSKYKKGQILISTDEPDDVINVSKGKKDRQRITMLELAVDKDINETLRELGAVNMSIKDIAVIIGMPRKNLQDKIDKGERDFNDGVMSEERLMYINYMLGLKSLEAETVVNNLRFKNPDKLLASINPEKYSDTMLEKYTIPVIELNFGDNPLNSDIEDVEEIENDNKE